MRERETDRERERQRQRERERERERGREREFILQLNDATDAVTVARIVIALSRIHQTRYQLLECVTRLMPRFRRDTNNP